ncbi:SOS response-associated peptidase [Polaromonas sp. UC242_47]|uniref:SOS response-associated peptidase n=1 Tax=Polaromonas sp. UC242_47 TaxID=3374626 RepID=UPI0037939538
MCSHFEAIKSPQSYKEVFKVEPPKGLTRTDIWPGYESAFIRRPKEAVSGDEAVPDREAVRGVFGLVPHWADDLKLAKRTYNARSETVATKPSFRDAWKWAKHCIIPADAFYEPDWRSGKAVATRIARADGHPMGIAGLWSTWKGPEGEVHSFTMLTVNATDHAVMKNFHKPDDEKRMVVILPVGAYDDWLNADPANSMSYMQQYPADRLVATAEPKEAS